MRRIKEFDWSLLEHCFRFGDEKDEKSFWKLQFQSVIALQSEF